MKRKLKLSSLRLSSSGVDAQLNCKEIKTPEVGVAVLQQKAGELGRSPDSRSLGDDDCVLRWG